MEEEELIISRLKSKIGIKSNKELSKKLGLNENAVATWLSRKTVNYQTIIKFATEQKIDLNYIFNNQNNTIKNIDNKLLTNNRLFNFPLKAIVAFNFLLQQNQNIQTKDMLIQKIEEFYQSFNLIKINKKTDFTTKLDKKQLILCIKFLLHDKDVNIIFSNKNYYQDYFNFLKEAKRWI